VRPGRTSYSQGLEGRWDYEGGRGPAKKLQTNRCPEVLGSGAYVSSCDLDPRRPGLFIDFIGRGHELGQHIRQAGTGPGASPSRKKQGDEEDGWGGFPSDRRRGQRTDSAFSKNETGASTLRQLKIFRDDGSEGGVIGFVDTHYIQAAPPAIARLPGAS